MQCALLMMLVHVKLYLRVHSSLGIVTMIVYKIKGARPDFFGVGHLGFVHMMPANFENAEKGGGGKTGASIHLTAVQFESDRKFVSHKLVADTLRIKSSRLESVEKCAIFIEFETRCRFQMCRSEFRFIICRHLRSLPLLGEREAYPVDFSPF